MSQEPQMQARAAQHYAGIRKAVTMDGLASAVDQGYPELFGWLAANGIAPAAAPFIRYLVIDMAAGLQIELGVPVSEPVEGDEHVRAGILPSGRYAVLRHIGPYDGLAASNAALEKWASQHGVEFDVTELSGGSAWRSRVEHYLTDPSAEPDPSKWETDIAYLAR
jgi:effector-binding domain-containing protein